MLKNIKIKLNRCFALKRQTEETRPRRMKMLKIYELQNSLSQGISTFGIYSNISFLETTKPFFLFIAFYLWLSRIPSDLWSFSVTVTGKVSVPEVESCFLQRRWTKPPHDGGNKGLERVTPCMMDWQHVGRHDWVQITWPHETWGEALTRQLVVIFIFYARPSQDHCLCDLKRFWPRLARTCTGLCDVRGKGNQAIIPVGAGGSL